MASSPAPTPGRKFFDEHMDYIYKGNVDGMIDDQYTQDAVLFSPFDVLGTPPPHVVRGNAALKDFFRRYMAWQGAIQVEQIYDFCETADSIFFQAIFTSNTGRWVVGDAWHMRSGKIDNHYSFAHKIG
jgi:hypothetical protein